MAPREGAASFDDLDDEITADGALEEAAFELEQGQSVRARSVASPEDAMSGADEPVLPKRERKGLARRLLDGVRDVLGGGRPIEARGRIVVDEERRLVVEVTIPADLSWSPVAASLVTADGRQLEVTIDQMASTRAGDVARGQTVRLALTFEARADAEAVHVTLGQGTMVVRLVPRGRP